MSHKQEGPILWTDQIDLNLAQYDFEKAIYEKNIEMVSESLKTQNQIIARYIRNHGCYPQQDSKSRRWS